MANPGDVIVAGRVSGERIATSVRTGTVGSITNAAEVQLDTVTGALVSGRVYRLFWGGNIASTNTGDIGNIKIRQDNTAGTVVNSTQSAGLLTGTVDQGLSVEGEYTAVATGNKTLVVTGIRVVGAGTLSSSATATNPAYLYIEYVRG